MKILYQFTCLIYNFIITFWENYILVDKKQDQNFKINSHGFELLDNRSDSKIIDNENQINTNKYTLKKIVTEKSLLNFLNNVFFENNLASEVTKRTNFNYSIDFFINYQICNIPEVDRSGDWHANKWHTDKPFSKNTLKIIIPLNNMTIENYGAIQIIDSKQSRNVKFSSKKNDIDKFYEMKVNLDKLLIFLPNKCFHKAGNPSLNLKRSQIMIQLNPSKKWCINKNIYKKQFNIEPKFPYFNYMFDKKIYINNKK